MAVGGGLVYPEETDLDSAMSYVDGRKCRTPGREGIRMVMMMIAGGRRGCGEGGGGGDRRRDVVVVLV